jgi:hypothetical protein
MAGLACGGMDDSCAGHETAQATEESALFAVEPVNFAVPVLGAVDEFVLVPLVLHGQKVCVVGSRISLMTQSGESS